MLFALRAGLLIGLIALLAVTALSVLSGQATHQGLRQLEIERLRFLVSSLSSTVEANLGLGLPIEDLPALQALLERDLDTEPNVRAIEIVGPQETALYSTERGAIGEAIPQSWREAIEDRHSDVWLAEDRGEVAIGEVVRNDFDQPTGHVVLIVAGEQVHPALSLSLGLAALGWPAVILTGALAFLLTLGVARLRLRAVTRGTEVWTENWTEESIAAADAQVDRHLPTLKGASLRARRTRERALQDLESARRRLVALDNED
ncbi:MAG: hypothetical protein Kilf2KO_02670 [Rhodospirillales bacterium]